MSDNINYLSGRKKYARPQAMLWSENSGAIVNETYVPIGFEVGANAPEDTDQSLINQFLVLSDDSRSPLSFSNERIETKERMINGRMRSYYVADKLSISTSWDMLPSRSFSTRPGFDENGNPTQLATEIDHDNDELTPDKITQFAGSPYARDQQYTTDGGAGGVELLKWYEAHPGPFWVFLAYDRYDNFEGANNQYQQLHKYNQVVEMFISDFSYSVQKRGGSNYDFWDISVTLEEV
jgi:hypothetical protein